MEASDLTREQLWRGRSASAGLASGVWFSVAEVGGVTGPLTVGALADTTVGYEGAMLTVAGVSLFGAVVALISHQERRRRLDPGSASPRQPPASG